MNLTNRVEKLEQQAGAQGGGVRFVARYPPKMTREEWDAYARKFTEGGGFTVNLNAVEVSDEPSN
jgi:hypothetical protein